MHVRLCHSQAGGSKGTYHAQYGDPQGRVVRDLPCPNQRQDRAVKNVRNQEERCKESHSRDPPNDGTVPVTLPCFSELPLCHFNRYSSRSQSRLTFNVLRSLTRLHQYAGCLRAYFL